MCQQAQNHFMIDSRQAEILSFPVTLASDAAYVIENRVRSTNRGTLKPVAEAIQVSTTGGFYASQTLMGPRVDDAERGTVSILGTAIAVGSSLLPIGIEIVSSLVSQTTTLDGREAPPNQFQAAVEVALFDFEGSDLGTAELEFLINPQTIRAGVAADSSLLTGRRNPANQFLDVPCLVKEGGTTLLSAFRQCLPFVTQGPEALIECFLSNAGATGAEVIEKVVARCFQN